MLIPYTQPLPCDNTPHTADRRKEVETALLASAELNIEDGAEVFCACAALS